MKIECRPLNENDVEAYRGLRLQALTSADARAFAADPKQESSRTMEEWKAAAIEAGSHAVMGAFDNDKLIGIMALQRYSGDKSGRTAHYRGAYIAPEYRKTNASTALMALLDTWAEAHGFSQAVFAIRADATAWIRKHTSSGAEIFNEEPMTYADGVVAPTVWLRKDLG